MDVLIYLVYLGIVKHDSLFLLYSVFFLLSKGGPKFKIGYYNFYFHLQSEFWVSESVVQPSQRI